MPHFTVLYSYNWNIYIIFLSLISQVWNLSLSLRYIITIKEMIKMTDKGISIVISTGTEEKMVMLGVLTQTAVNLGMPLRIFVTGTALPLFLKDGYRKEPILPRGFEGYMKQLRDGLQKIKFEGWHELLQNSVKDGDVKVYVCSLMSSALNIQKKDLDPMVEDIVGATNFMIQSAENQIITL